MPTIETPLSATVIAAFLGAVVAVVGLIISKESKVSDFRQSWVDQLRGDVAALVSHAQLTAAGLLHSGRSPEQLWADHKQDAFEFTRLASCVRLRLNPKEHVAALSALATLESTFQAESLRESSEVSAACKGLVIEMQKVLKSEWEAVKNGEPWFRQAKRVAAFSAIAICFTILLTAI